MYLEHKQKHSTFTIHKGANITLIRQRLPTLNIFELAPNKIFKFRKYPLFQK